jgi:hypothetical protein
MGRGLGRHRKIAKIPGLGSFDPDSMSDEDEDAARVIDYTRTQRPDILCKTVAEKPRFVFKPPANCEGFGRRPYPEYGRL